MELEARAALNISWEGLRQTRCSHVAADPIISEGDIKVKYDAYLLNAIVLQFVSTDRNHADAARFLRLAGISTEVERIGSGGRHAELADAIAKWLAEICRQ
ncbi:MAG: hypothetical protein RXR06_04750 [Thermoproteus sp.]